MSVANHSSPPQHGSKEVSQCQSSEVVVGCRKSELALVQSRAVISTLRQAVGSSHAFRIVTGSAAGDTDKQTPFILLSKQTGGSDIGKSLWTNDLEADLVAGKSQVLVHCLKDMPTTLPPKCLLAAVPEREDPSDAVIMRPDSKFKSIDELPPGSVVGSSSSRRKALVRRNWPHLEVVECRGNVQDGPGLTMHVRDTRLAKLDAPSSQFSCILLATAGLMRLGLGHRITQRLDPATFPYAAGQGALGIEISTDRQDILQLVRHVDHRPSRWRGMAERAMLRSLQGGCSSPIGVCSTFESLEVIKTPGNEQQQEHKSPSLDRGKLHLQATVLDMAGTSGIFAEDVAVVQSDGEAEQLGVSVAKLLVEKGAQSLLRHVVDLEAKLASLPIEVPKIPVFESLYSMSGSVSLIEDICDLAENYGAITFLDEVHTYYRHRMDVLAATLQARPNWSMLVVPSPPSFIFTTSLPPAVLAGAKTSIEYQAAHNTDRRLQQLHTRATRAALIAKDIPMITNPSHIIPLLVGDAEAAKKGEEKLRITPTLGRGREFTDDLVTAVDAVWTELGIKRTSDWVAARPDGFLGVGQADQPHNKPLWTDEQFGLVKPSTGRPSFEKEKLAKRNYLGGILGDEGKTNEIHLYLQGKHENKKEEQNTALPNNYVPGTSHAAIHDTPPHLPVPLLPWPAAANAARIPPTYVVSQLCMRA
ncbi:putative 5-aminolevulinate synthase [Colletotrichum sublineola]|uniref:hydroxymethylbilane synthase n=1 Tax=Colletotrichum sublineola TaxID=1173701 RepID=A0A066XAL8_COLSU|nr:putative 5-aminolevulinate synthase [Colletotrichum sublineola]